MLDYCLDKARELSVATHRNARVYAAVLDRKGRIIGEASNSFTKTHPKQGRFAKQVGQPDRQYLHAEAAALIRALRSSSDVHTLVVGRVIRNGSSALAAPCPVCNAMIKEAGVAKVIYSV